MSEQRKEEGATAPVESVYKLRVRIIGTRMTYGWPASTTDDLWSSPKSGSSGVGRTPHE
jgi:hypothetical protein